MITHVQPTNERRTKRMKADYLMSYSDEAKEPSFTNIRDISAGGLKFVSYEFIPEGTVLTTALYVPPIDRMIACRSRVIRVHRLARVVPDLFLVCVAFQDLDETVQKKLNEYISRISFERGARAIVDHRDAGSRNAYHTPL